MTSLIHKFDKENTENNNPIDNFYLGNGQEVFKNFLKARQPNIIIPEDTKENNSIPKKRKFITINQIGDKRNTTNILKQIQQPTTFNRNSISTQGNVNATKDNNNYMKVICEVVIPSNTSGSNNFGGRQKMATTQTKPNDKNTERDLEAYKVSYEILVPPTNKTEKSQIVSTSVEPIETSKPTTQQPTLVLQSNVQTGDSVLNKTPSTSEEYMQHVIYLDDGSAIYTDPTTKYKYKWDTEKSIWQPLDIPKSTTTFDSRYENEHYKWCHETNEWKPKFPTETEDYKWDPETKQWLLKEQNQTANVDGAIATVAEEAKFIYSIDENGDRIRKDQDGVIYIWDKKENAWFPKIDDDFMARYQMSYGFIDNTSASEEEKRRKEEAEVLRKEEELKRLTAEARQSGSLLKRKNPEPPKWFDLDKTKNTKVYVSNLPVDVTLDEFGELMSKCGMIMRDPITQKLKLKLYAEKNGQLKGDGLCDYIKVESVELALKILDEYDLRGHIIRVRRAKFKMRGQYDPSLKPKRRKQDKEKFEKMKERLFDWRPEKMRGERTKNEKIVIIKNYFTPQTFDNEVQLILEYQTNLRNECSKCGIVRKVVIYDRHPDGVAQVNMSSPEEADLVIEMMHGRFFGNRQLSADHWDGKTKYKVAESETEISARLNLWEQYLETDEEKIGQENQA